MQNIYQRIKNVLQSHRKLISFGTIGVALVAGVLIMLFDNRTDEVDNAPPKPTFQNYLKPAGEIKVGSNRYVSACQVLNPDDVKSIFNSMGEDGYIREDYYDTSPTPTDTLDSGIETNCYYMGENDNNISLKTEQSFEALNTRNLRSIVYSFGEDKIADKIKLYEKATANSNDSGLKQFIATLKQSAEIYDKHRSYDSREQADLSNFVIPIDRGLFSFNLVQDNAVYKFDYTIKDAGEDEFNLSDQEIEARLKKSAKAIKVIQQRIADTHLDQSPTPTILGDTEKVGTTKVLEPCAILTAQLYQSVIGSPANDATTRMTVNPDITKERFATATGEPRYPYNQCRRDGGVGDIFKGSARVSTIVTLDLNYNPSSEGLQAKLDKGFKFNGNDKLLQTNADWAAHMNVDAEAGGYIKFRVGAYSGSIDIHRLTTQGFLGKQISTGGTEQQYLQLVNAVADYIKQQAK